jgi:hypothetical protein
MKAVADLVCSRSQRLSGTRATKGSILVRNAVLRAVDHKVNKVVRQKMDILLEKGDI